MTAVAWGLVVFAAIVCGWRSYALLTADQETAKVLSKFGMSSGGRIIQFTLEMALYVLTGLILVSAVRIITRIDRKAAWVAWRGEALQKPLTSPPGSSLPFILPLTVTGGLVMILGVVISEQETQGAPNLLPNMLVLVATGMLLVLAGLGCGELHRFFWRMGQLGRALPSRKRGDELTLGPPARSTGFRLKSSSASFMFATLALVFVGYLALVWQLYETFGMLERLQSSGSALAVTGTGRFLAMAAAGFIGIVGGAFTLHRLSEAWSEMLYRWEGVAQSLKASRLPHPGKRSTAGLRRCAWALGAGIIGLQAYGFFSIINKNGVPLSIVIAYLCLPLSAVCFIWWLGALKQDTFKFASAARALRAPEAARTPRDARAYGLGICILALASVLLVWYFYDATEALSALRTTSAVVFLSIFLVVALTIFPFYWLVLSIWDLDRAAGGLEGCGEVKWPNPTASPTAPTSSAGL